MLRARSSVALALLLAFVCSACGRSTDSLGYSNLSPLTRPSSYPNPFRDLLGKSQREIDDRIEDAFQQLFHGDASTESIYTVDGNGATIRDTIHGDERTEGFGLAMLIAVELGKRDEFDRIWRGAQKHRIAGSGDGYFSSNCDTPTGSVPCDDPFGLQQFVMALIFANARWKGATATVDYADEAMVLVDLLRNKEQLNGGIINGFTNTFDADSRLIFEEPHAAVGDVTRPSLVMPAYYALWAQATGDAFFRGAAGAGRQYLSKVAHKTTGLTPVRATFEGASVANYDTFLAESYRVQFNLMLDQIWTGPSPNAVVLSDRLLAFFSSQGKDTYGSAFSLDGATLNPAHEGSLVSTNGFSAVIATRSDRSDYVSAVWGQAMPVGPPRYYSGLMQLLSLMSLGGRMQVF